MPHDESDRWLELNETERDLVGRVLGSELMSNTARIASWVRLSGSPAEAASAEFVRAKLADYGLRAEIVFHDALISLPGRAALLIESPDPGPRERSPQCITHSFGVATPADGLAGELVYVGDGSRAQYDDLDVRGKIVLIEGLASPETTKIAEDQGAAGHIHINDANLHEMTVSPVWGSPESADADRLPHTPALSVLESTGELLKGMLRAGPVRVRMFAEVDTGWRNIPLVLGTVPGKTEPDRYVLLSGHLDSWHRGAMDNGSANATMLEVARLLARNAHLLRRGLRVAFWSGHSHGRYAGSAWYADQNWPDIERNCIAHVNVDSTGAKGAAVLGEANVMAEARDLASGCVRAVVPDETFMGTRFGRAGDQSFWGAGVPSLYMSLSQQPAETGKTADSFRAIIGGGGRRGGGLGWWWHTEHDTMDKIDEANLVRDTRIYLLTVLRLCMSPVLPLDYRPVCDEFRGAARDLTRQSGGRLDLVPLQRETDALQVILERVALVASRLSWQAETGGMERSGQGLDQNLESLNRMIMRLGRLLIPASYVAGSRFGQDPALPVPRLPGLAGLGGLAALDTGSPQYHMARIQFVRQRNRIEHALAEARAAAEEWLSRQ
ncbi:MAG: M28 family peptidase [Bacillota bacterium]|nr:M28 family peptidase [Bacillota bacterium]